MHLLAAASAVIQCPQALAFDYAADLANFAHWFPGVVEVQPRDVLPPATAGKRYEETFRLPLGGSRKVVVRVVEAQAPRRFVTEGALPGLLPRMEVEVRALGPAGCELQWRMWSRNRSALARWTWLPLAGRALQRRADAAMPRLRQLLEASAAPPAEVGLAPRHV